MSYEKYIKEASLQFERLLRQQIERSQEMKNAKLIFFP